MKKFIWILLLFLSNQSYAFLPPEMFIQVWVSFLAILASWLAFICVPFILIFKFVNKFFKKYKKNILFIFYENIILVLIISLFFYLFFYKALQKNIYISTKHANFVNSKIEDLDLSEEKQHYIKNYLYLSDQFWITNENILKLIDNNKKVFFIDWGEKEEFDNQRIEWAVHIRSKDITVEKIKKLLNLNDKEFNDSLFIIYCNTGTRSTQLVVKLDRDNIKFIINWLIKDGGLKFYKHYESIFPEEIMIKEPVPLTELNNFTNISNTLVLDFRNKSDFISNNIEGSVWAKVWHMTIDEYNDLWNLLEGSGNQKIIAITWLRYGNIFYAKLLLFRIINKLNYDIDDYKMVTL